MYKINLYQNKPEPKLIHTLTNNYFKGNFRYLQLNDLKNVLFYQASNNTLVGLDMKNNFQKIENYRICQDFNIHDFATHDQFVYVINNNSVKDNKNKSTVKIFKIDDKQSLFSKRSFKNVQELKMVHNKDYSLFIIHA